MESSIQREEADKKRDVVSGEKGSRGLYIGIGCVLLLGVGGYLYNEKKKEEERCLEESSILIDKAISEGMEKVWKSKLLKKVWSGYGKSIKRKREEKRCLEASSILIDKAISEGIGEGLEKQDTEEGLEKLRKTYQEKKEELQVACDEQIEEAKEIGYGESLEGEQCESIRDVDDVKKIVKVMPKMKEREMVLVSSGSFMMGCTSEQGSDCYGDEKPSHKVTISRSFYIGKYEVTKDIYNEIMGKNLSSYKGGSRPVEMVSWYDTIEFLNKLSERDGFEKCYSGSGKNITFKGLDCEGYRLPTEAEWEYAAREERTTNMQEATMFQKWLGIT